ncbi:MAG: GSU3473 family protein [Syntrophorhabdales bacterium]
MIHVRYQDNSYDYVDDTILDYLIASNSIKEFYRPSDAEWVDINEAPIRGAGL